jgi:tRNA/tmRNA/rRNA uracil-C5-methylase (TrmA/RlmC/RlmD family)
VSEQDGLGVGDRVNLSAGKVAHGGHFVARHDGRVIFVRHSLPGESVVAEITKVSKRHAFADAIEILDPAPQRVTPPCEYSGPGGCGGCDFQHVSLQTQRLLKQQVVEEQLQRMAGLELTVPVVAVPGDEEGLRWRTRMQYVALPNGKRGLRAHQSHRVIEIDDCLIARPDAREPGAGEVVETVVVDERAHSFRVAGDGFWQVHPGAPTTLVSEVLDALQPEAGETIWDLYGGVGLFSAFLADRVGPTGKVICVEQDRAAIANARKNLAEQTQAQVVGGSTKQVLSRGLAAPDLVVLDPPRSGAGREVVELIAATEPRSIAYVACDPAALARDLKLFAEVGYVTKWVRGFDLFPMTQHVECVALLVRHHTG